MSKITDLLEIFDEQSRDKDNKRPHDEYNMDRALYHLLEANKDSLPEPNDYFHKAFRQIDVTDSGHTDMAIWCLLSASTLFWQCFEIVQGSSR